MRFFIILTIDIPWRESIGYFQPERRVRRKLQLTEDDDQYEYGYLEGDWERGKHRKYAGELNRADFETVVSDCGLLAEQTDTLGSLTGYGWLPAIAFYSEEARGIVQAYVTPIPDFERTWCDRDEDKLWERVKSAVCKQYRYGV